MADLEDGGKDHFVCLGTGSRLVPAVDADILSLRRTHRRRRDDHAATRGELGSFGGDESSVVEIVIERSRTGGGIVRRR